MMKRGREGLLVVLFKETVEVERDCVHVNAGLK